MGAIIGVGRCQTRDLGHGFNIFKYTEERRVGRAVSKAFVNVNVGCLKVLLAFTRASLETQQHILEHITFLNGSSPTSTRQIATSTEQHGQQLFHHGKHRELAGADYEAAQTLLALSQPADPADTQAARTLLAISQQPIQYTHQPLTSTARVSALQHRHSHTANPHTSAALPLYTPPPPVRTQDHDHRALTTYTHRQSPLHLTQVDEADSNLLAPTRSPTRLHQYTQADSHAAQVLLSLNLPLPQPESLSDGALVSMYWFQLDDATVQRLAGQYGVAGIVEMSGQGQHTNGLQLEDVEERVREVLGRTQTGLEMQAADGGAEGGETVRVGEPGGVQGGQSRAGRVESISASHTGSGGVESGERRDSAYDQVRAAEWAAQDERSLSLE
ncbi:hypothetical protein LTR91_005317 [Friedmanniomyces endolithicus]|uniref:Uncharacterized protein n=1 Tax=Friedmanniomyces endolithicus TaxID=329885 RepID=A0AAN6KUS0_9PEZI|nr:hypothetical protein LTR94_015773 [Friedmanniomyces endolithicus]KAK0785460.1 hypothetical protein LTR59_011027 [Friedmanniomyces endolithicus]KAK0811352.1 hypothetical protein LTR38_003680 [Friedmanniomyces endolithicus]KAK0817924.1 hypothetical protein LTR75_002853 [Friedmanniomyces endolithicus]KAK0836749.1 hypothetical protein LTR03_013377 [Friedmanniomyces endolithicus]